MTRILKLDIPAPRIHHRGKTHDSPVWISSNERTPRMAVAAKTAKWIRATEQALHEQYPVQPAVFERRVLVTGRIWKPTANRYDPMNLYPTGKAIVDALTRNGILHDDDWTHVLGPLMDHGGRAPRGSEHITITIEEL